MSSASAAAAKAAAKALGDVERGGGVISDGQSTQQMLSAFLLDAIERRFLSSVDSTPSARMLRRAEYSERKRSFVVSEQALPKDVRRRVIAVNLHDDISPRNWSPVWGSRYSCA